MDWDIPGPSNQSRKMGGGRGALRTHFLEEETMALGL